MISVIIPVYNEEDTIAKLVEYLLKNNDKEPLEILVCDGGSSDRTIEAAEAAGAKALLSPVKGRAAQMNYGASLAKGDVLYFVHADTFPPFSYISDIKKALQNDFSSGRYRTTFDSKKWLLRLNAFFTRFNLFMCYGGDQTFFITRQLFNSIGGFNANMRIMEDYEIVTRAKKTGKYKIIQKDALVSARKYDTNSWLNVQKANYTIVQMYKRGATQQQMVDRYKQMLNYR